jgi:arylsulfatase A-like enzyme
MAARRPNLIYIFADDMGYGDVSCLNPESQIKTTHIDRLGDEGMRFRDAHASSAVCTPSRYSVLTGRYNWRSTLKKGVYWGYSQPLIEQGRMTVASLLKLHGYATACFGKWHLGMDMPTTDGEPAWGDETGATNIDWGGTISNGPTAFGFDQYYGISASLDMPPYVFIEDDHFDGVGSEVKAFLEPNRPGPADPGFEAVDVLPVITRKSVEFVEEQAAAGTPFFAYVPLNAPHTPLSTAPEFSGSSGLNAYADFCLQVDATVGAITAAVERGGVAEDTIIVFTSDNGCSPMADFEFLHARGHRPSHHFRGHKADIYEGGHRIPLVLRWPAGVSPGAVCEDTVCLADLLATMADLVGAALPPDVGEDSVSLARLLAGDTAASPVREATVHHSVDGSFSIRRGRWKLEMCPGSGGWSDPRPGEEPPGAPPIQLYDLDADIGERQNVQAAHPEVVTELTALLTRYVRDGRSTPGIPQANTGARHWPQLNWLAEHDL